MDWILTTESSLVEKKKIILGNNISIGRESKNDIIIKKKEISRIHAQFKFDPTNSFIILTDLNSANGTFVNGRAIKGDVLLKNNDEIAFELIKFKITMNQPELNDNITAVRPIIHNSTQNETAVIKSIGAITRIIVVKGNVVGNNTINLNNLSSIIIGRSSSCDLVLDDLTVSGEHVKILYSEGKWIVTNLSTTNGLFVDGQKVIKASLKNQNIIDLGNTAIRFETTQNEEKNFNDKKEDIPNWMRQQ